MDKVKVKKVTGIVANVLVYLFLAICIFSVIITVFSKRSVDGAAEMFGYQMRIVTSDSMAACEDTDVSAYEIKDIPIRSMVFIETAPEDPVELDEWYGDLEVGDVLTFRYVYATQVTITHRISSITEKEPSGFIIELVGDNKGTSDSNGLLTQVIDTSIPNNTNYVIGKVTGQSYPTGVVVSFLAQPIAIILVIILPCAIIIILEVIRITRILNEGKRQIEKEENQRKDNELEELRRRLAELEQQQTAKIAQNESKEDKDE